MSTQDDQSFDAADDPQVGDDTDAAGGSAAAGEDSTPVGHPSQAEGEDPAADASGQDVTEQGHPSQAEGEDRG